MAPQVRKVRKPKDKRRYVRSIDELGRVVVPVEFRRRFGLQDGSPVEMYVDGDRVCLLPYEEACMFCGAAATFGHFRDRPLCRTCAESLALLSETPDGLEPKIVDEEAEATADDRGPRLGRDESDAKDRPA